MVRTDNTVRWLANPHLRKPVMTIKGFVKFFNTTKGWGFTTPETSGKVAFVHISPFSDPDLTFSMSTTTSSNISSSPAPMAKSLPSI